MKKKPNNKIKTALVESTQTRTELSGWNKISRFMKREERQFFFFLVFELCGALRAINMTLW